MFIAKLKKIFIPHETNNFHPHAVRHTSLLAYALILLLLNYLVFPLLGLGYNRVSAAPNLRSEEIIRLVNEERVANGLTTLVANTKLISAATAKGRDMVEKQYWSHYGPSNESPWDFIEQSGYVYKKAGENLAKDFTSNVDMHLAWMRSPTHRANILNENFKDIGIGIVQGEFLGHDSYVIVQMFGTPAVEEKEAVDPNLNIPSSDILSLDKNLKSPEILSPQAESVFDTETVKIEGRAESGDSLRVYSNNNLIGELPLEGAAFTANIELTEDENQIFVTTKDTKKKTESFSSNKVNVVVKKPDIANILNTSVTTVKASAKDKLFEDIKNFSLAQKVNSAIIIFMTFVLLLDFMFLAGHGINRDSSHHGLNLGLVLVVLIGALIL